MPVHDWTRVSTGTFHDFHSAWITHLKEALNAGVLPQDYYAMAEQHAGEVVPDVLTFKVGGGEASARPAEGAIAVAEAPPKVNLTMIADEAATYRLAQRTLTIRHSGAHDIVALLEIVSPANKDRAASVTDFVNKAVSAIRHGYHLLIIDLHPPGQYDPQGVHGAIWQHYDQSGYTPPSDKPLTLAAYAVNSLPRAYVEPLAVGVDLPDMPLFLLPDRYVNVPLERTYQTAYRGLPAYWREVLEGRRDET